MPPIVYIAGPITPTKYDLLGNFAQARDCAVWCVQNNIGYFSPHLNSIPIDLLHPMPHEFWMEMDRRLICACEGVIFLSGWEDSRGCLEEHDIAVLLCKKIFYFPEEMAKILTWHKGECEPKIFAKCKGTKSPDGGSGGERVPCDGVMYSSGSWVGGCGEPCRFIMHLEEYKVNE